MTIAINRRAIHRKVVGILLASSALCAVPAFAQDAEGAADAAESDGGEIIVTAQKRSENLQDVPISIQALGTAKLQELNITDFRSYSQQLPSVAFQATAGGNPGINVIYMRGVASGGDGNHSGSLPSVGVYLDEQPVTTVGGNLDVHIYDIARIESLAGPQGTLYGASSQAGTIRIITNKPDTSGFSASFDDEINIVRGGDFGGKIEGMVNAPLSENVALRVVAFYQKDGGYITNVAATRCFLPDPGGICVSNGAVVEKNYNDTQIYGGRAALKIDLDDNWTVTPQIMAQQTKSHGSYGFDPQVGDLKVERFLPEDRSDKFVQAALTIEGKIGNWDLTYAGAYLDRRDHATADYTDYAEAYDSLYSSVGGNAGYFYVEDLAGNDIDPRQHIFNSDHFKKMSQELRIASPSENPLRVVGGLFYQHQSNDIHQDYRIANLSPLLSVNGLPGTLWLTQQHRVDKDYAAFGELSYDIAPTVTATAGVRAFKYDNTLIGFFGFGRNPAFHQVFGGPPPNAYASTRTGVAGCFTTSGLRLRDAELALQSNLTLVDPAIAGSPCTNLGVFDGGSVKPVRAKGNGLTYRFNLNWKPNDDVLLYTTVSRGFRPGGINRRADVANYRPDYLTNFEFGWKTTLSRGVRLNGAIYQQKWNSFQFSYLGANSFTEIHNGPNARIRGMELDLTYNTGPLNLNMSGSYTDAKTLQNLCLFDDPTYACTAGGNLISAPKGTRLPITPKWKFSGTARFTQEVGAAKVYSQFNLAYQSSAASDIRSAVLETYSGNVINPAALLGRLKGFGTLNFAAGGEWDNFNIEFFINNLTDTRGQASRFQQCGSCGQRPYVVPITPRLAGVRVGLDF